MYIDWDKTLGSKPTKGTLKQVERDRRIRAGELPPLVPKPVVPKFRMTIGDFGVSMKICAYCGGFGHFQKFTDRRSVRPSLIPCKVCHGEGYVPKDMLVRDCRTDTIYDYDSK